MTLSPEEYLKSLHLMEQHYAVGEFVTLVKKKKKVPVKTSPQPIINLYQWLKEQGFAQTKQYEKTICFQRVGTNIKPTSVIAMRYVFLDS